MKKDDEDSRLASFAAYTPLVAALLAPMSTLYDIPALSQPWYAFNGAALPDPRASLVLSGVSLAMSVIANSLLVLRFSVHVARLWRFATRLSTLAWVIKTCIGIANLITFGALARNGPGYSYLEGFWCAILSVVISGIISTLLVFQFLFHFNRSPDATIRFQGRTFIVSELILFGLIALEALIFSKIEGWTYLEGIYFSVVALLSIGFGDFSPSKTSTKILLFPFAIAGIALLSNQVSLIVKASSARRKRRRQRFARLLDTRRHANLEQSHPETLEGEARRLHRLVQDEENASELADLLWSAVALVVFWLLGALIYRYMESWTYGNALYFNYVFFLTIGFGDYSPETPVGRVVFVLWALLAVPIMTNFVVQAIQSIVGCLSPPRCLLTTHTSHAGHALLQVPHLDDAREAHRATGPRAPVL
ncbi:voltage-gated potassium channel [Acaromyces ingoldii]|uniref:Voltage-gated potassium channel n=1 Tax=Acaromyces ingoldii TaxID=215250 RepID=A0A316YB14_9BASI|nr:voltage-gated potassium channel [Acaromyces ingoldii]PWN86532.1 voltage-gated potassium channel [Acaromyces ingoldii]